MSFWPIHKHQYPSLHLGQWRIDVDVLELSLNLIEQGKDTDDRQKLVWQIGVGKQIVGHARIPELFQFLKYSNTEAL